MKKWLIDAEQVNYLLGEKADDAYIHHRFGSDFHGGYVWTVNQLQKLPEAVIRCQECRKFLENWKCTYWHRFTKPDGFCHIGERRANAED